MEFPQKICSVCGDIALGYNFDALTCESCKAFFRRNALRNKNFRCTNGNGNCIITIKTRKYCRHCRLNKCLSIGMKKDWMEKEKFNQNNNLHHAKRRNKRDYYNYYQRQRNDSVNSQSGQSDDSGDNGNNSSSNNKVNIIIMPIISISNDGSIIDNSKHSIQSSINDDDYGQENDINEKIIKCQNGINNLDFSSEKTSTSETLAFPSLSSASSNLIQSTNEIIFNDFSFSPIQQPSNYDNDPKFDVLFPRNDDNNDDDNKIMENKFEKSETLLIKPFSTNSSSQSSSLTSSSGFNDNHNYNFNQESVTFKNNNQNIKSYNNYNSSSWLISDNVYKHALQLEFGENPLDPSSSSSSSSLSMEEKPYSKRNLNKLEKEILDEVNQNFSHLYYINEKSINNLKFLNDIDECFEYFENSMKKLIMCLKNISSFKNMCQDDQILLLKGSASDISSLTALRYCRYSSPKIDFYLPDPLDSCLIIVENEYVRKIYGDELWARCLNFLSLFRDDWRNDESILNLLSMILLFHPDRANSLHKEYVMLQYSTYGHLLQNYLIMKYNSICEAKTIYLTLLSGLEELIYLNEKWIDSSFKLSPHYIGPLTVELFNLNQTIISSSSNNNNNDNDNDVDNYLELDGISNRI